MQQCNELINCITGYIVEMRLDLDVKELQYSRNGAKYVTTWHNIEDTSYIAVLSVYTEGDSIHFISYQHECT